MGGAVKKAAGGLGSVAGVIGKRGGGVLFGRETGQRLPGTYAPQNVGAKMQQNLRGPLSETKGEKVGQDVMSRMQQGLGGYTGAQERAMFQREADRVRAQQALASKRARQAAVAGGLGGGLAAKMQQRLASQAQAQQAGLGRDLSLANIAEQQRRLQNLGQYAGGMAGIESARRGQAAGLAAQQAGEDRTRYLSELQKYMLDPRKQTGGIMGGLAEKLLPGMGGDIYRGLRFG